ncbi:MAG: hypothetical protein IJM92_00075 [Fibrobacter sp.]|uniref:hypothetical protein n=1 Tax=Fibrobacter sp. TaxID=35828 RepID=UPI0025C2D90A|nr:hypothetical protein [Fibrobacter sp.]MBQ7078070.1 hypothetical protein [Fibrobacter sp.]
MAMNNTYQKNRTWLIYANETICDHIKAFQEIGKISWSTHVKMQIGDVVYVYVGPTQRRIMFRTVVAEKGVKQRVDKDYWKENLDNKESYTLKLDATYQGSDELNEEQLCKHGFKGGRSLLTPNCNNVELLEYIQKWF